MRLIFPLVLAGLLSFACAGDPPGPATGSAALPSEVLPVPSQTGAAPNLYVAPDGSTYLSWIEYLDDTTDALQFARLTETGWSAPATIASGSDWFVNWADFPSLVASSTNPDHLAAHWLQKSAAGTYDYDVRISQSTDGGRTWSPAFVPHRDGVAAEHGFVSLLPLPNGRIFATWLDGRYTKSGTAATAAPTDHHDHGGGAMTLRAAEFDATGQLFAEAELDHWVCDCCQTDAALGPAGPIVVYRDRSEEEIRDIAIVRRVEGRWTEPLHLGNDNWHIAGCPVNGPALAVYEQTVAVAWYTAADTLPRVQVAFSTDGGATFGPPLRLDDGQPIGRVDIVLTDAETALVSWLEAGAHAGAVRLARVDTTGHLAERRTLTPSGTTRQSGFPILERRFDDLILAWTAADRSGAPQIRTLVCQSRSQDAQ
jgi:hypothetical protein